MPSLRTMVFAWQDAVVFERAWVAGSGLTVQERKIANGLHRELAAIYETRALASANAMPAEAWPAFARSV